MDEHLDNYNELLCPSMGPWIGRCALLMPLLKSHLAL